MIPELAIIIPTYEEKENIPILFDQLKWVLQDIHWEVVVVDDNSPDGTADVVHKLAMHDPRIRCIKRIGRTGLSSACIEGMLSTSAEFLAVMDADLQHDESLLPRMLHHLRSSDSELVIASRFLSNEIPRVLSLRRRILTDIGKLLSKTITTTNLSDPMSGFFMTTRRLVYDAAPRLSGHGFKVLLDLVTAVSYPIKPIEIPFIFRPRQHGTSKLDTNVTYEHLLLLLDKLIGRYIPIEFMMFILVGSFGALLHFSILALSYKYANYGFLYSQVLATIIATIVNYTLNNIFTHRDKRLRGFRYLSGLLMFLVACLIGALANLGISSQLFSTGIVWWLAGISGAIISAVWNFGVTRVIVWRKT